MNGKNKFEEIYILSTCEDNFILTQVKICVVYSARYENLFALIFVRRTRSYIHFYGAHCAQRKGSGMDVYVAHKST